MKLEIARGLFLVGALGVASLAAAAWHQPGPSVLSDSDGFGYCRIPANARTHAEQVRPDQDLLLFMFSLTQGLKPQG
ncbi:hypothetical protein BZL41_19730 [Pseudomonas sp. PIC25]|uniref:hypothetical protein n=1 Tax=Pseudomonas sp. PIC25 TaxID=1958773 RepID=UPI000BAB9B7D|nr:hypothetical protein [Pseudomonas sp. PIC25]PAU56647.1 hypothetical protein BZL41_19730 [Pseudomonas sp. PIC25]